MAKTVKSDLMTRLSTRVPRSSGSGKFKGPYAVSKGSKASSISTVRSRVEAVMAAAESSGLLGEKDDRISGRVSHELIEQAKKRTGIEANTDLIEFALANLALEDNFADAFRKTRGKVDPELKLGF